MLQLVPTTEAIPAGGHALSFYASRPEVAHQMAGFLRGAQERDQDALVLTADDGMLALYRDAVEREVPEMLAALHRIPGPHVQPTPDGWRPLPEVGAFASAHPDGASMCGDTLPSLISRRTIEPLLAYEDWFDDLRPFPHRGLCPYDLTIFPVDRVPEMFTRLGEAHSHLVLSDDPAPAAQFLQLLVLPLLENPPEEQLGWLVRAADNGLVDDRRPEGEAAGLTPRGEQFARALRGLPSLVRAASADPDEAPRGRRPSPGPRYAPES